MKKCEKDFPSFNYNNPAAVSFINLQAKFISFSYLISDKLSLFLSRLQNSRFFSQNQ